MCVIARDYAAFSAVIVRLGRAIQYSETSVIDPRKPGVLDAPLEPVIGLAEGETRWRGMTIIARSASSEAIQLPFLAAPWIASLALAMTPGDRTAVSNSRDPRNDRVFTPPVNPLLTIHRAKIAG